MPTATIAFDASITIDGEEKQLSTNGSLSCHTAISGTQTVGNTYEPIATGVTVPAHVIIYNTGTVDVAVQVTLSNANSPTSTYHEITCVPGGIVVVPPVWNDKASFWTALKARTHTGTADIDYCIIR
jgi:hypothetical protein